MILSDIGEKKGDLPRQLNEIRSTATENRNARRSENTSIGEGGLRLYDTGGLTIDDGGMIHMKGGGEFRGDDGGKIQLYHPGNEIPCFAAGTFVSNTGTSYGVAALTVSNNRLFNAVQNAETRYVAAGDIQEPLQNFWIESSQIDINGYGTGTVRINPASTHVSVNIGTGTATAVQIDATGRLFRATSSIRYKQDLADLTPDPDAVLRLRPRTWRYKQQVQDEGDAAPRASGFIAEEVEAAGLPEAVTYVDGQPDGLDDRALTAGLVALCQRQQEQLNAQAKLIRDLEARVTALEKE